MIYLDGNSLGMLPAGVAERIGRTSRQEWGDGLIRSWNPSSARDWMELSRRVAARIAPLVGVDAADVHVGD